MVQERGRLLLLLLLLPPALPLPTVVAFAIDSMDLDNQYLSAHISHIHFLPTLLTTSDQIIVELLTTDKHTPF